jgi:hypothetical protein
MKKEMKGKAEYLRFSRVRPDTHQPWTLNLFLEPINQWFVSVWLWNCEISIVVFQKGQGIILKLQYIRLPEALKGSRDHPLK